MLKKTLLLSCVLGAATLGACEKTKEQFDFSKKAPDEFAVVKRAPLEMPPDYHLRPPRPGQSRPQENTAVQEAQQAVFGSETLTGAEETSSAPMSEGEAILLQKVGTDLTAPDIRDVIDAETRALNEEEKPTIDRIIGGVSGKKYEAPAEVVNAKEESQRIKENLEQGKSLTDGPTPTVTR